MGMAVAGLVAAAAVAQAPATAPAPAPAKFVSEAGASDKFEIESAYVMKGAKNPAISSFANRMMIDHKKSTAMIVAAAKADGLTPKPAELTVKQRADITALKAVPAGKTKDDLYVKQQKASHDDALALMQSYAAGGSDRHLKAAAAKIVPVVEGHIKMLTAM